MKPTVILLAILLSFTGLHAQNLVNNYSLETYSTCPNTASQITYATGWNTSKNSPEYLNFCSSSIYADVPTNYFGFQAAATGNAYGGGLFYGSFASSYLADLREFFYVTLTTPLTIGTTYYVTFKANLVDNSEYAVNNLGAQFCTTWNSNFPLNNTAHVYTTSIVNDKTNWTTITGSFIPSVAYNAVMIGNFFTDVNTSVSFVGSSVDIGYNAYYFIDDVQVTSSPVVLPVTWSNTAAEVNGKVARISWEIDAEDIANFYIERSADGREFSRVKTIPALQFSSAYTTLDTLQGYEPMMLYRIRAVTNDGSTHLSPVLEAQVYEAGINFLQAYPSPVKSGEQLTVEYNSGTGEAASLQVISLEGKIILKVELGESAPGHYVKQISTEGMLPGVYWLKAGGLNRMITVE